MKKIILGLSLLLFLVQDVSASMCSLNDAKQLVNEFLSNEIEESKHPNISYEIKAKEMISKNAMKKAGIKIRFLKAKKYQINSYLFEDYKILGYAVKGNSISFSVELDNYSYNWYITAEIRVIDEDNKCKILPSKIQPSSYSDIIWITPYFNATHHSM